MAAHADARTLVILGNGYTGRVIYRLAAASRRTIRLSSRTPERSLADFPASAQLGFDLADPTTWVTIPDQAEVIVTFPAQPVDQGLPGEAYNVSAGTPRRWSDIMDVAAKRWQIPLPPPRSDVKPGKRVQTDKLRSQLGYVVQHPDLFDALEVIEGAP
ncbi:MAG: hypothetical protein HZB35_08180 [Nitrospirae bacterium]|nr:hypothetical protein [Nitrospirota bacterium]